MDEISVFFPLRAGSSRVKHKNTRPFHHDGRSLFQFKIDQISRISHRFSEVIVSTNDPEVIDQFPAHLLGTNIRIERRPDALCQSTTKVQDLIGYVPTITQGQWVFWLHATSPFVNEADYVAALDLWEREVLSGEKDSIMSVNRLQQFIWSERERCVINTDRAQNPWPNTQDLDPLYEINHAFYINSRKNYLTFSDRIGRNPALYVCEGLRKIDIDWPDDFEMARSLLASQERPLNNYATLVFDCDGVVLDSNRVKTEAFHKAALPYGEDAAAALAAYHVANGGVSRYAKFAHFLERIVPRRDGPSLETLLAAYAEEVRAGLATCVVAEGLEALRAATRQARWMIVSGGDQAELRDILSARGLAELFDGGIFGSPDTKDAILAREIASGNLRRPALFLGDSRYDHLAARTAGLDFVFISGWSEFTDWQDYAAAQGFPAIERLGDLLPRAECLARVNL